MNKTLQSKPVAVFLDTKYPFLIKKQNLHVHYSDMIAEMKENKNQIDNNLTNKDPNLYNKTKLTRSLLDDYADVSVVMPDYVNED